MKRFLLALLLVSAVLALPGSVIACPSCRDALATAENKDGTPGWGFGAEGEALSVSVLFMLSMPFVMASCFGFAFYRLSRPQVTPDPAVNTPDSAPGSEASAT